MRIAFLADGSHPNCYRWAEHYAAQGETVVVFDFVPERFERKGVEYRPIRTVGSLGKLRYVLSAGATRRAVSAFRPDVLIGYRLVSFGYLAARTGLRPLVLAAQGQNLVPPGVPLLSRRLVRLAVRDADLLHAWSRPMAERMMEFGAVPGRILVRPRGIRVAAFSSPSARAQRPTLISTRQLEPYYNQRVLIETVARLRGSFSDVELVLVGRGSAETNLRQMAGALGVSDHVRFAGFLDEHALIRELERSHVYASAVPTDGVSSSLLEAMAAGCYPVVADNRANREWIRGTEQGALCPANEPEAFASAVSYLLASPGLRDVASEKNRAIVRDEADWDRNMTVFLEAYRNLLGRQD